MATLHDQKVLAFMFDPFLLETLDSEAEVDTKSEHELTAAQREAKKLEIAAIELANSGEHDRALQSFESAITTFPERASIYNNRAQVYRLLNRIDDAKSDLDRAISLSDGSELNVRDQAVARQAYCQRALIHLLRENKDQGISDMSKAAEMGNGFAKSYMAKMNPYAALCNQMLREMFEQYRVPTPSENHK